MQKRNTSTGILQNPMGLRQAQLSETQLPASFNFTWKSKTIISVKTLNATRELHTQPLWINWNVHSTSFYLWAWQEEALAEEHREGHKQSTHSSGTPSHLLAVTTAYQWATACNSYQWASLLSMSLILFFSNPSFWQMFALFYKTGRDVLPIFKNAFETTNPWCYITMLYNSNLLYNVWKKNNLSHYFSKCIKLLTQWDEQCFLME